MLPSGVDGRAWPRRCEREGSAAVSDRPTLHFSSTRRPARRRVVRVALWLLGAVLVVAVVWALILAALWGYAWWQLDGDEVSGDAQPGLGSSQGDAPPGATTVLVTMTGPVDPTVPRPSALAGPVALVQVGERDDPAVLLLPEELPVTVDGSGELTLAEVQLEGGGGLLMQAIADYAELRIDHLVSLSSDALPELVELVGPVEVCMPSGCTRPDGPTLATRLATADDEELARLIAAVSGALGAEIDRGWVATSPLAARRVVEIVAREVTTDLPLRGGRLLDALAGLAAPTRLDLDVLPSIVEPSSGVLLPLHEPAMARFQQLREGTPLAGSAPDADELTARLIAEVSVAVLNGAGIDGLAGRVEGDLEAAGFRVVGTGNAPSFDVATTLVQYVEDDPEVAFAASALADRLPGTRLEPIASPPSFEGGPVDLLVTVGSDRAS